MAVANTAALHLLLWGLVVRQGERLGVEGSRRGLGEVVEQGALNSFVLCHHLLHSPAVFLLKRPWQ